MLLWLLLDKLFWLQKFLEGSDILVSLAGQQLASIDQLIDVDPVSLGLLAMATKNRKLNILWVSLRGMLLGEEYFFCSLRKVKLSERLSIAVGGLQVVSYNQLNKSI